MTAEIVKKSDGAYRAGDEAGLSGLEARYDERLRGTPGADVEVVDAHGRGPTGVQRRPAARRPARHHPRPRACRRLAEQVLAGVAPATALVAIRPSTGDVLAAASGPGGGGLSHRDRRPVRPRLHLQGGHQPGPAALRARAVDARCTAPRRSVVDGKRFKNYDDYPPAASAASRSHRGRQLLQHRLHRRAGDRRPARRSPHAAAALGVGVDHDLGFPAYFGGSRPPAEAGSETGHAASLIGQGRVHASPLAMATVAASVAKGSVVRAPAAAGPAAPTTHARRSR